MYGESIRLVELSRDILKLQGYFVDNLWHIDDIHFLCEEKNYAILSDSEAMQVFQIAAQGFDGEFGFGWSQLEKALEKYMVQKTLPA